ncbi:oxaloacetate decarboxylase [Agrilactobacillus composti DSM 18527 = JCM 14202]|uniref:Oxaloacetate decarboxylase n=2 Tax=Agrilactobacillus TaxID=2767875 RepID=X0PNY7_9LACO|nr:oxaloacetate decarboxylase subunit alpha [Agrilactobacillus composti]KRM34221.1 oxaloacetate decarboxylase [Agrilactobacillus composti DSM 18527 = JCM 14202]GAF39322.1 oxaloacetate decarboxylase alpha chain [Agrilactobacillus composti DSM 18527 = JCM 14202]
MKKQVKIMETVLRDGHQSLAATRMSTAQMLPILDKMDQAGYYSMEVWGGATFDSALRFLHEDPWERLRLIRKHVKNTKLQMLLRGQNLLGYRHYADDFVKLFVQKSVANGIDVIRIFDALNDPRNLRTAVEATKAAGGEAQTAISYTTSAVHSNEYFLNLAKEYAAMGADSIAIKDMAGIMTPENAYELTAMIKDAIDLPLEVHTHATSGIATMTYLKAVEAGADIIDTAISPFAGGTSQPATESMVLSLQSLGYDVPVNMDLLSDIADYFKPIRQEFLDDGIMNPKVLAIEPKALIYQVPGGMLSNLLSQLTEQGQADKYDEVLQEVPKVRKDLGYPPLVTPLSQMVGTQSVMNVLSGERYKLIPKEIKEYVRGLYGKSPAPISPEIKEKIIGDEPVITQRPADLLQPELPTIRKESAAFADSDEDVLSYGLFPQSAKPFLMKRKDPFYDIPIQTIDVTTEF